MDAKKLSTTNSDQLNMITFKIKCKFKQIKYNVTFNIKVLLINSLYFFLFVNQ